MLKFIVIAGAALSLSACIGTDFIDDPFQPVDARIEIQAADAAVEVGASIQLSAVYYDTMGERLDGVDFIWRSSEPSIASVDATGRVEGLRAGRTMLTAEARGVFSSGIFVNVVDDPKQVARVVITPGEAQTLSVGTSLQLTAQALNLAGDPVEDTQIEWQSDNTSVVTVSSEGIVNALSPGTGRITASSAGIESAALEIVVSGSTRSGSFTGRPGSSYRVEGTATLRRNTDGSLQLEFSEDFSGSRGPGLEVLLSSTNTSAPGSISLGSIKSNTGAQVYDVPADVELTSFDWVVIHCRPFNVTFGFAELD